MDGLNAEFDSLYLETEANPRWVAKPVVAYLWARTAECGGCRPRFPCSRHAGYARSPANASVSR